MIRYLRDRNYRSVKPVGEGGEQCKAEREGDDAGGTATAPCQASLTTFCLDCVLWRLRALTMHRSQQLA